mgnify:CR=1 FL=1
MRAVIRKPTVNGEWRPEADPRPVCGEGEEAAFVHLAMSPVIRVLISDNCMTLVESVP